MESSALSAGAIAGISAGGGVTVVLIILIAVALLVAVRRSKMAGSYTIASHDTHVTDDTGSSTKSTEEPDYDYVIDSIFGIASRGVTIFTNPAYRLFQREEAVTNSPQDRITVFTNPIPEVAVFNSPHGVATDSH